MVKERLSQLQKWILTKGLNDQKFSYRDIFMFFGKKYTKGRADIISAGSKPRHLKERYGNNYKKEFDIKLVGNGYDWYEIRRKEKLCATNSHNAVISRSFS